MAAQVPPWGYGPPPARELPRPHTQHHNTYPTDPRAQRTLAGPEVGGFYNPALASAVPRYSGQPSPQPPHLAHSYSTPSYPAHSRPQPTPPQIPGILKPGGPARPQPSVPTRSNSGDLFFEAPIAFPQPHYRSQPQPPQTAPPFRHGHPGPPPIPPHIPHKSASAPPLPPKPSQSIPQLELYPQQVIASTPHQPIAGPSTLQSFNDIKRNPSPAQPLREEDEDAELRRALELSAMESEQQRRKTLSEEDAELERALQESLKFNPLQRTESPPHQYHNASTSSFPQSPPLGSSSQLQLSSSSSSSSAFMTPENVNSPLFQGSSSSRVLPADPVTSSPLHSADQIAADEALARRILEEEQQGSPESPPAQAPASGNMPPPPTYNEVVAPAPSTRRWTPPLQTEGLLPSISTSEPTPLQSRAPTPPAMLRRISANATLPTQQPSSDHLDVETGRPNSWTPGNSRPPSPSPTGSSPARGHNRMHSNTLTAATMIQSPTAQSPTNSLGVDVEGTRQRRSSFDSSHTRAVESPPVNPNQFVDAELLRGVSLGFNSPGVSASLTPMQGPIPNVVALPYGKCPPFHVKAPSWRDLIKFMARLSGTRLEPTIEAMAVVKTDMKMRVVVNFVKVHQSAADWHVILYMSIDYAVPANHPQSFKYKNGDPNLLPFSYTLLPVPPFLRDGADAPMSKWYSIPATSANPFPKLPITFPDLAGYLLSVLQESRGAMSDSSSGMRRLAKLVDSCCPVERPPDPEEPERRRLIDRLMKRGNRQARDRNADTYDIVTPFYADEFGA